MQMILIHTNAIDYCSVDTGYWSVLHLLYLKFISALLIAKTCVLFDFSCALVTTCY